MAKLCNREQLISPRVQTKRKGGINSDDRLNVINTLELRRIVTGMGNDDKMIIE